MDKIAQEVPTIHHDVNRLEDVISAIESRVFQQNQPTTNGGGIPAMPQSVHVLENVKQRINDATARLESVLKSVSLL